MVGLDWVESILEVEPIKRGRVELVNVVIFSPTQPEPNQPVSKLVGSFWVGGFFLNGRLDSKY